MFAVKDERWACDGSVMITANHLLQPQRAEILYRAGRWNRTSRKFSLWPRRALLSPTRGVRKATLPRRLRRRPRGKGKKRDGETQPLQGKRILVEGNDAADLRR
ncbi:MAG: hypothetical protein ACLRSW_13650 [Christensenellaceae bacterium]